MKTVNLGGIENVKTSYQIPKISFGDIFLLNTRGLLY